MLRSTLAAWRRSLVCWLLDLVSYLDPAPELLEVERAHGFDEPMPSDWPAIRRDLATLPVDGYAQTPEREATWLRDAVVQ